MISKAHNKEITDTELQILNRKLSKHLRIGIIFSLIWLGGIGSLVGLINGIKAYKIVEQTHGQFGGKVGAWFCILLGTGGIVIWGVIILGVLLS